MYKNAEVKNVHAIINMAFYIKSLYLQKNCITPVMKCAEYTHQGVLKAIAHSFNTYKFYFI